MSDHLLPTGPAHIRRLRGWLGLSQREVAEAVGVPTYIVSYLENGAEVGSVLLLAPAHDDAGRT